MVDKVSVAVVGGVLAAVAVVSGVLVAVVGGALAAVAVVGGALAEVAVVGGALAATQRHDVHCTGHDPPYARTPLQRRA